MITLTKVAALPTVMAGLLLLYILFPDKKESVNLMKNVTHKPLFVNTQNCEFSAIYANLPDYETHKASHLVSEVRP